MPESKIKNHFQQNYRGRKITYITQTTLNGIVGAIELTREAIKDDDFIVWLGDEYMHTPDLKGFVSKFRAQQYYCLLGAVKEERIDLIKKTYSLSFDHENHIEQLIEKPQNPVNNYRGTGCVLFRNEIFQYINDIPNNNIRNERDYVDLIQAPIHDNKVVAWYEITDKYINVNDQEDLEFLFSTWNK